MLSGVTVLKMMPAHCFLVTQEEIKMTIQFLDNRVFEGQNKGGIRLTWYNWKAHEVL